jgi:hypothetical protein
MTKPVDVFSLFGGNEDPKPELNPEPTKPDAKEDTEEKWLSVANDFLFTQGDYV